MLARQMEIYAGYLENTDHHVGLLIDALEDLGILDDTLIYVIIGDNGASAEGSLQGTFNEMITLGGLARWRRRSSWRRRSTSSAVPRPTTTTPSAGRTPWTRPTSGPSRSPRTGAARATARSCTGRDGIEAKGEIRTQFHHVIDVAPTVLEVGGPARARRSSTACSRSQWKASAWPTSFDDADAAERHETQYFEMFGNRGIYHKGWTAVTKHRTPWETGSTPTSRRSTTTSGSCTTPAPTGRRRTISPRASGEAARAAAALADRGGQVQRRAAR